ncbi:efflux RND transporter periplasmic adaptor subunit [Bacillus sp. IITD106]|nr:efflux RND transporter periplasmic adaptor subunit [Bacillus sp. IITD106]
MKVRWRRIVVAGVAVLILTVNLVLLEKNGSKAERLNYISSWKELTAGDLVKTLMKEGVVAPSERHPVFVDQNLPVKEFLVKKGEKVEHGSPLFEYETFDLDAQIALLDSEITRLEAEKKSIETFVSDLEKTKSSLGRERSYVKPVYGEDDESNTVSETIANVESARQSREQTAEGRRIDQSIAEKELDLEKVDSEIEMYEEQRDAVENGRSGLTVLSAYDGIVEDISFELNNPVITIVSEDLFVEGRLSESEVADVEEGMRVDVHSDLFKGKLTGEVATVDELPAEKPALERASLYPFTAVFGAEDADLYSGYHVQTDIVLDEALDVPVVRSESVLVSKKKSYLWVLNRKGMVEKRKVNLGLQVGNREEVKSGVELGEIFARHPKEVDRAGKFITPFKGSKHLLEQWEKDSFRKKLKSILVGVLQR